MKKKLADILSQNGFVAPFKINFIKKAQNSLIWSKFKTDNYSSEGYIQNPYFFISEKDGYKFFVGWDDFSQNIILSIEKIGTDFSKTFEVSSIEAGKMHAEVELNDLKKM